MAYDIIVGRDEADRKKFGDKGTIFLGKSYVKMGKTTSLSNNVFIDVVRSHVILVAGKRGSGKSHSLGVIAEGISGLDKVVAENLSVVIFDTMGIFWTMKYPNEKERGLLKEWGMKPEGMDVKIYTPKGFYDKYKEEGIPTDYKFSIRPSELTAEDWILTFELEPNDPVAIAIEKTIYELKEKGITEYSIEDIINVIGGDKEIDTNTKNSAKNRFMATKGWGLFDKEGTKINEIIQPGKVSVLDISCYTGTGGWGVKALVIGLVTKRLFLERMVTRKTEEIRMIESGYSYAGSEEDNLKEKKPMIWLLIDECLPYNSEIITDKAHTKIGEVVRRFKEGESFKVLGYDPLIQKYGYYDVEGVYEKGKRELLELITETGRKIRTTPNHKVLTDKGFKYSVEAQSLAVPLIQHHSKNKNKIKARLLGHIFGDGWVSRKTQSVGFAGKGDLEDLEKIKEDLSDIGFSSSNIQTRKTSSEIKNYNGKKFKVEGISQQLTASRKAFNYFLKLGPPVGKKTLSKSVIPSWLLKSGCEEKAEFLAALMGSDGQIISVNKNVKSDFNAIRLSFNKLEFLEKNAFEYANHIKKLFNDLGIDVSQISKKPGNLIKDGRKTIKIVITLSKNIKNTIRFLEKVGYRYCKRKEETGIKWLSYLKARQFIIDQREGLRKKVIDLHNKEGLGKIKIGKKLSIPDYWAREWIYFKGGVGIPKGFPGFKEWIDKRCSGEVVYENIIEKKHLNPSMVYDIAVKDVHNFIANGCVVHNCHEFLPKHGKTAATDALVTVLREGRQPGVSLILATQQPGRIHRDVMTQSDLILSHRITAKSDVEALNEMMQSYQTEDLITHLNNLPREAGAGIILDDNSERIYPLRVRPRFTWHGGEAPTAITYRKRLELGLPG